MIKNTIKILLLFFIACKEPEIKGKIDYYTDGYAKSMRNYNIEGKYDGLSIWFYPNGFIKQQQAFKNGLADGNAFYFYSNGALKSHRYFKNNMLDGFRTDYFNDSIGLIKAVVLYKAGKVIDIRKGDTTEIE